MYTFDEKFDGGVYDEPATDQHDHAVPYPHTATTVPDALGNATGPVPYVELLFGVPVTAPTDVDQPAQYAPVVGSRHASRGVVPPFVFAKTHNFPPNSWMLTPQY